MPTIDTKVFNHFIQLIWKPLVIIFNASKLIKYGAGDILTKARLPADETRL